MQRDACYKCRGESATGGLCRRCELNGRGWRGPPPASAKDVWRSERPTPHPAKATHSLPHSAPASSVATHERRIKMVKKALLIGCNYPVRLARPLRDGDGVAALAPRRRPLPTHACTKCSHPPQLASIGCMCTWLALHWASALHLVPWSSRRRGRRRYRTGCRPDAAPRRSPCTAECTNGLRTRRCVAAGHQCRAPRVHQRRVGHEGDPHQVLRLRRGKHHRERPQGNMRVLCPVGHSLMPCGRAQVMIDTDASYAKPDGRNMKVRGPGLGGCAHPRHLSPTPRRPQLGDCGRRQLGPLHNVLSA
jgi:hypothetical protein